MLDMSPQALTAALRIQTLIRALDDDYGVRPASSEDKLGRLQVQWQTSGEENQLWL